MEQNDRSNILLALLSQFCAYLRTNSGTPGAHKNVPQPSVRIVIGNTNIIINLRKVTYSKRRALYLVVTECLEVSFEKSKPKLLPMVSQDARRGTRPLGSLRFCKMSIPYAKMQRNVIHNQTVIMLRFNDV